jgi:dipeptidase E
MKLLLTSGGITNPSIRTALENLLGKPVEESTALFVPTAEHPLGPYFVGRSAQSLLQHEWKAFGVLELTALPGLPPDAWLPHFEAADALLVGGGDALYLAYWMQQSGLAARLPALGATVYVGMSAGSMVLAPHIGQDFVHWRPPTAGDSDQTLGLVDFAMFPHLDNPQLPDNTLAAAEGWAARLTGPAYAMDDATAIQVLDGTVEIISEGHWQRFPPGE